MGEETLETGSWTGWLTQNGNHSRRKKGTFGGEVLLVSKWLNRFSLSKGKNSQV